MLAAAVTSGSAAGGAATTAAIGLGTLPTRVTMGSAAAVVARAARRRGVRAAAGALLVAFGLVQLAHVGRAWASMQDGVTPSCCAGHHDAGGAAR